MNTAKLFGTESENSIENMKFFVKNDCFRMLELTDCPEKVFPEIMDSLWDGLWKDLVKVKILKEDEDTGNCNFKNFTAKNSEESEWRGSFTLVVGGDKQLEMDFALLGSKFNYKLTAATIGYSNGMKLHITEDDKHLVPLPQSSVKISNQTRSFKNIDELQRYINSYGKQLHFREHSERKLEGIVLRETVRSLLVRENLITQTWKVSMQDIGGHRGSYIFTAAPNARRNVRLYGEIKVTNGGFKAENFSVY